MAIVSPTNNPETNRSRAVSSNARRTIPRRQTPSLAPVSRYDGSRENTWHPSEGLGSMPPSANADTTVAAVTDPWGDGRERVLVTVNRRVDVLETERSHDRISDAAYTTGRVLQAAFERQGRVGGSNWAGTSRRDPREVQSEVMVRTISNAMELNVLMHHVRGYVGERNLRILRRVLGDRLSFAECASFEGKAGPRGQAFITESFRVALEDAVAAIQAVGKVRPTPDDAHAAAAADAPAREDASLVGGATLGHVEAEIAALHAEGARAEAAKLVPMAAGLRLKKAVAHARRAR